MTARTTALGAAALGAVAVVSVVFLVVLPREKPPAGAVKAQPLAQVEEPASLAALAAVEQVVEAPPAPCDRCLNEPGALEVAETFLYHMRAEYIGIRGELYSDIAARLEAAGLAPPHRTRLPKLPPGLVDAPANYSLSRRYIPEVDRPGETWVVWVQEGWYTGDSLDHLISIGDLPAVAASWPPLKWETYLLVDARTGAVDARAMWPLGSPGFRRDMPAYGDLARREAAKRAEHWIAKGSAAP